MAVLILWKDEYNTGCQEIDQHHQTLAQIVNELYQAFEYGLAESKSIEILKKLEDYTKYHFQAEEELMAKHNYPGLEAHKLEHQRLIKELKKIKEQILSNQDKLVSFKLMLTLKDWILDHILDSDHKYKYICQELK